MQSPCPNCGLDLVPSPWQKCLDCCDEAVREWKRLFRLKQTEAGKATLQQEKKATKKEAAIAEAYDLAYERGFEFGPVYEDMR